MRGSGKNQGGNGRGAKPVAEFVSKLLDPIIERRAGMTLDLVASWEEIAGEEHASFSRPKKLDWPRKADEDDPFQPATLVVACEGPRALYLQADGDRVIARINAFFGFAAVARLKVVQSSHSAETKPVRKSGGITLDHGSDRKLALMLAEIDDPQLRDALERMGRGVFSESSRQRR